MTLKFKLETIIGVICLIMVLLFGQVGFTSIALISLLPLTKRLKKITTPDEREVQLYQRANSFTLGFIILFIVGINFLSELSVNGNMVGNNWMFLTISAIILSHGLAGLIIFSKN